MILKLDKWKVIYNKEVEKDLKSLDNSRRIHVQKAINKISQNPVSIYEGGYGKPLGNKNGNNLTGYYKIKLLKLGIRVIYKLVKENNIMKIIVVSVREDDAVYQISVDRISD